MKKAKTTEQFLAELRQLEEERDRLMAELTDDEKRSLLRDMDDWWYER